MDVVVVSDYASCGCGVNSWAAKAALGLRTQIEAKAQGEIEQSACIRREDGYSFPKLSRPRRAGSKCLGVVVSTVGAS